MKKTIIIEILDTIFDYEGKFEKSETNKNFLEVVGKANNKKTLSDAHKEFRRTDAFKYLYYMPGACNFLTEMRNKNFLILGVYKYLESVAQEKEAIMCYLTKPLDPKIKEIYFCGKDNSITEAFDGFTVPFSALRPQDCIFISSDYKHVEDMRKMGASSCLFGKQFADYDNDPNRINDWNEATKVIETL